MKIKFIISFIIFFVSANINAEIPRNSITNIKQLTWSKIIDAVSETYQYATMVTVLVNKDGSNFYYPADEKYGKLSKNGIGQYKYREPEFGGLSEYTGDDISWSIDKKNNQICYGEAGDLIDEHLCTYLFEGFENDKKYLYFSMTEIEDFYARINQIVKINSDLSFDQWSYDSDRFSKENILYVHVYGSEAIRIADSHLDFSLSDFCYLQSGVQEKKGIYYFPNEEVGISATSICIYKDAYGQYRSKGKLINGMFDGNWNWWNQNGQKLKKVNFKDGYPEGIQIWWYWNGQTRWMTNFQDGYPEGIQTWWHENGQKRSESNYINGNKEGKNTWWDGNGLKIRERNYKNNKLVLETKYIYENGQLVSERNYKDGECISGC